MSARKFFRISRAPDQHQITFGELWDKNHAWVNEADFVQGLSSELTELSTDIRAPGPIWDLMLTTYGMPVARRAVANRLSQELGSGMQEIALRVNGLGEELAIINIIELCHCLDRSRSSLIEYPSNYQDPQKAGKIRAIIEPVLSQAAAAAGHCFRLEEYPSNLIADETIERLAHNSKWTGVVFTMLRSGGSLS